MSFDSDLASSLRENQELIEDLCRYSEGILTEKQVRQRWHLANDEVWTSLGADDFVERVELERVRRIRSGAAKREKAQLHVVAAADVLNGIMSDPKQSAKHRIDSAKVLNDFADPGPQRFGSEQDRVIIHIDMGADTRAKGLASDPADVVHIEATVRPNSDPNVAEIVDAAPRDHRPPLIEADNFNQEEVVPLKRGPGRPKGSKSRPKLDEHEPKPRAVPGFMVD
jgi:hypothetical protein